MRLLVVVVVVMGGVCVYVCVHGFAVGGGGVGESQPASFFQDMGKKRGGIALIPAQRGRTLWVGRSCNPDQPWEQSLLLGGRMGREQVLCFSSSLAVSTPKHSPWGPEGCSPPAHSHTHTHASDSSCTRSPLTTSTPQGGNQRSPQPL